MSLIVGSAALHTWYPEFRLPVDLDLICYPEELKRVISGFCPGRVALKDESHIVLFDHLPWMGITGPVEIEVAWPGSSAAALLEVEEPGDWEVADVYTLYWLKMSHRFRKNSPHFEKTRQDILWMRANCGIDRVQPPVWYRQREKETYSYGHPNLGPGQNKHSFFGISRDTQPGNLTGMGQGVQYYYDHDWVHTVVAKMYGAATPAYLEYKKDGEEVACDQAKFNQLPFRERLRGVMEEATVLALERSQIPLRRDPAWTGRTIEPEWSYRTALQKVCTSITSGWFRDFAWEHYDNAISEYCKDYVQRFWKADSLVNS